MRCRLFIADVDESGTRRLGEDRRCFADIAEVDRTDIQPFEKLRPGRELHPFHLDALRRQVFFQGSFGLEQGQQAGGFLETDAQQFRVVVGPGHPGDEWRRQAKRNAERGFEELAFHDASLESCLGGHSLGDAAMGLEIRFP